MRAINEAGLSEGNHTKEYTEIEKEKIVYIKPVYVNKDITLAPQFTMPLNNRKLTVGYTGTLSCAVKGHPKPKIRWFKNKEWYQVKNFYIKFQIVNHKF